MFKQRVFSLYVLAAVLVAVPRADATCEAFGAAAEQCSTKFQTDIQEWAANVPTVNGADLSAFYDWYLRYCFLYMEWMTCYIEALPLCPEIPAEFNTLIATLLSLMVSICNSIAQYRDGFEWFLVPWTVPQVWVQGWGDPHYLTLDGEHVICDELGVFPFAEYAVGSIFVEHSSAGSGGGAIISKVIFDAKVVDVAYYLEVNASNWQSTFDLTTIATTQAPFRFSSTGNGKIQFIDDLTTIALSYDAETGFALSGYFPRPIGGILVNASLCSGSLDTPSELAVTTCAGLSGIWKDACEYDVTMTNNTKFLQVSQSSRTVFTSKPDAPVRTNPIESSSDDDDSSSASVGMVSFALVAVAAFAVVAF